ncbi:MAG: rhomboid family intramembrane serine protease [Candidatus Micrarchaeota archaeon]
MDLRAFFKKIPWASLLLIALILASYAYFVAEPYASETALGTLGLSRFNLLGIFTHEFMHQGLHHLLSNLLPLLTFAILLESAMSAGGVLTIFFAAGAAGGLAYLFFDQGALIIGASAASSGLMAAATALRPKQAVALALLACLIAVFVIGPVSDYFTTARKTQVQQDVASLSNQTTQTQAQFQEVQTNVNQTISRVSELEQQGKTAEAERERAILTQQQAALAAAQKAADEANASLAAAQQKAAELARGEEQASAPISAIPHAVGALVGLLLVIAFRKQDVDDNMRSFKEWFSRLRERASGNR